MIVGFQFTLENTFDDILNILFDKFQFSKYLWKIENEQAWNEIGEDLFVSGIYSGKELEKIFPKKTMLVMMIKLYAFKGKPSLIQNYSDYFNHCELAIYITDCCFIEIYCKSNDDFDFLLNNSQKLKIKDLEYINDDGISRTEF